MDDRFDHAYRMVFGLLAGVTIVGALLARTVPQPDWSARVQSTEYRPSDAA